MAEIVQSLFGVTPEMYQRQQQDRIDAQALRFAQLDPFQQANFAIGRGANMLGGAIGGALGGQDPELQRITMRQQIARQIDLTNPESIQEGMAMLQQAGDTVGLQQLAQIFRQQQESGALIAQRTAAAAASTAAAGRERAPPTTNELTNARAIAAAAGPEGSPAYNAAFRAEYQRLTAPKEAKGPAFGAEAERAAAAMFDNKTYAELTPAQKAEVNKAVDESKKSVAAAGAPRLPGAAVPTKDWMDFSTKILSGDPTMVRTNTIISDAPSAIEIIRTATGNDISAAALPGALARLTGEGKNMSNQDVARFARTGGLADRLVADAVKFFTGRGTKVKKDQAERFATALYRGALIQQKERLQNQAEQFGYLDSPNYKTTLQQLDNQLARFKLAPKPGAADAPAGTPPAGGLTAAEQAELDQLRSRYRRNPQ
jgi:hypothetical protein